MEEHKREFEERKAVEEEHNDEEVPRVETITVPYTETRTRSEKQAPKPPDKNEMVEQPARNQRAVNKKDVPPGPGEYTLPSDVSGNNNR